MNNIKEMERKTTEIERKAKKLGKKIRFYAVIVAVLIGLGLAFYLFMKVSQFYDENKIIFQSPILIKIQAPIKIERRVIPQVKPKAQQRAQEPVILAYPEGFEEAYNLVWTNESGKGKDKTGLNGYCISKGMINEIGYDPQHSYCFNDQKEQKETFMLWLSNRLNKVKMPWCNTIGECISIYSAGGYTL